MASDARRDTSRGRGRSFVIAACSLAALASASAQGTASTAHVSTDALHFTVPAWAFPGTLPPNPNATPDTTPRSIPGSTARFSLAQMRNLYWAPDWQPDSHPPMPDVVAHGRNPGVYACAYCHLPNGRGRPENATLAGLPAAYIIEQIDAFRSGARKSAVADWAAGAGMGIEASRATDAEIAEAAAYFSKLKLVPRERVVETARVPKTRAQGYLYVVLPDSGTEPLGHRIIETPASTERHELHDPNETFVTYVPRGSLTRGRAIATKGGGVTTACVTCHGPDLRGVGVIPPLAGRSPTYIVRQLAGFRTGTRSTTATQPMSLVTANMGDDDMIAVAAYIATRRP